MGKDIVRKVCKYILDSEYRFVIHSTYFKFKSMPDDEFLKRKYHAIFGKELHLDKPESFNEKLQWLKLFDRKPEYVTMVDKHEAKEYVAQILGKEYIIPTLGVWNDFDEIDFTSLPQQFVLKCTHDSGGLVVCRDKDDFKRKKARKKIKRCSKKNFYWVGREWPYKDVRPRVIAEQYMEEDIDEGCEGGLTDYKFFCFNGVPKLLYVSKGLEDHSTAAISFYDMDGKEMPYHRSDFKPYHNATMPKNFDEMKKIAKILAERVSCPFVRIDLYSIKGKIYFSEITFTPCSGMIPFEPSEADDELGKLLEL